MKKSVWQGDNSANLAVFRDTGGGQQNFHCGVIVIYLGSDECVKQWLEEPHQTGIANKPPSKDPRRDMLVGIFAQFVSSPCLVIFQTNS